MSIRGSRNDDAKWSDRFEAVSNVGAKGGLIVIVYSEHHLGMRRNDLCQQSMDTKGRPTLPAMVRRNVGAAKLATVFQDGANVDLEHDLTVLFNDPGALVLNAVFDHPEEAWRWGVLGGLPQFFCFAVGCIVCDALKVSCFRKAKAGVGSSGRNCGRLVYGLLNGACGLGSIGPMVPDAVSVRLWTHHHGQCILVAKGLSQEGADRCGGCTRPPPSSQRRSEISLILEHGEKDLPRTCTLRRQAQQDDPSVTLTR